MAQARQQHRAWRAEVKRFGGPGRGYIIKGIGYRLIRQVFGGKSVVNRLAEEGAWVDAVEVGGIGACAG